MGTKPADRAGRQTKLKVKVSFPPIPASEEAVLYSAGDPIIWVFELCLAMGMLCETVSINNQQIPFLIDNLIFVAHYHFTPSDARSESVS